jgi:PAS domain S-box-containing protein
MGPRSILRLALGGGERGNGSPASGRRVVGACLATLVLFGVWTLVAVAFTRGAASAGAWVAAWVVLTLLVVALGRFLLWPIARAAIGPQRASAEPRLARILLDNLMAHFPGLVYFKDRESRFVRISDSHVRRFGLKSESEALGKTDHDMFAGEHARQAMRDEQEIMRTGEPRFDFEEKETWTDGRVTWVSTSKMPLRDESGGVIGTFGVSLDITARKQAEGALKESEAFFDSLVNSLPQNIFCKDLEGRFTFGNRAFCATVRRSLAEILGKTDFDLYPPERATRYRAEDQRVTSTGQPFETVDENVTPSGEPRFTHIVKTPRYDSDRRIVGAQGIFWDVTRRQGAENDLVRERDLLHALMDNIPDPIFFKDAQGRYTRVNAAQARLLGLTRPEEAVGRSTLEAEEAGILESGLPILGKVEQVTGADREPRWMLVTKVPIHDSAGRVAGLVAIARDITERKRAEETLERGLEAFLEFAGEVAAGDLTRRAPEGADTLGRIGSSVNTVLENFTAMLVSVRDAALSVASAAGEILAASRSIAEGAQRQTDEVNSTTTAVEEMAASMAHVSQNAESSARAALEAQANVEHGDHSVGDTFSAIARIDEATRRTADKMHVLEQRSTEISDVIDLIDDVAAQTKLLSLNAAIEAAHAGEAGLGFTVVAEEIRKLADRTARATKDVGALIEAVQVEIAEAIVAMERGVQEVEQGRALAGDARAALKQISAAVTLATRLGQDISGASQQQAQVTRELAHTMQTIATITLDSSTGAQQTAHTVQDLVQLSDQLTKVLARFKIPDTHIG